MSDRAPDTAAPYGALLARADNALRLRVIRAEKAALGAVTALQGYIAAANEWFEAAKTDDLEAVGAALDRLVEAHNKALAWARQEGERVRART